MTSGCTPARTMEHPGQSGLPQPASAGLTHSSAAAKAFAAVERPDPAGPTISHECVIAARFSLFSGGKVPGSRSAVPPRSRVAVPSVLRVAVGGSVLSVKACVVARSRALAARAAFEKDAMARVCPAISAQTPPPGVTGVLICMRPPFCGSSVCSLCPLRVVGARANQTRARPNSPRDDAANPATPATPYQAVITGSSCARRSRTCRAISSRDKVASTTSHESFPCAILRNSCRTRAWNSRPAASMRSGSPS